MKIQKYNNFYEYTLDEIIKMMSDFTRDEFFNENRELMKDIRKYAKILDKCFANEDDIDILFASYQEYIDCISKFITSFKKYYNKDIVAKIRVVGVKASHDFLDKLYPLYKKTEIKRIYAASSINDDSLICTL